MKKKLSLLSLLLCVVLSLGIISACSDSGVAKVKLLESTESIVAIKAEETKTDVSLGDVLADLKAAGKIDYTSSESQYGAFIESVNGKKAGANEFWAVYTSLVDYENVTYSSTEFGSYEYEGSKLGSANFGVDGLPIVDGMLYVLALSTY